MLQVVFRLRVRGGVTIRTCVAAERLVSAWLPRKGKDSPREFVVLSTASALPSCSVLSVALRENQHGKMDSVGFSRRRGEETAGSGLPGGRFVVRAFARALLFAFGRSGNWPQWCVVKTLFSVSVRRSADS